MAKTLRSRGIERMIKQMGITKDTLEFLGRISLLENDPRVKEILSGRNSLTKFDIYLFGKLIPQRGIAEILEEYGFGVPSYMSKKPGSPLQVNFDGGQAGYLLRFYLIK